MTRQLVLRPEVEKETDEAASYYESQADATHQRFGKALNGVFDALLASPRIYAKRFEDVRRVNVSGFPYALWFEIVSGTDAVTGQTVELVVLLHLFHQRRNITARNFG